MNPFADKTIVVPWDFSDRSRAALEAASAIAESPAKIRVVHVTPYPDAMEPSIVWGTFSEQEIRERLRASFGKEINLDDYPGLEFVGLFGNPAHEITRYADENNAGLIVISSHGRTGLSRVLLGSVAEQVVRLAHCPVLVLRDGKKKGD